MCFIDGALERTLFEERKLALLMERKGLEEERDRIMRNESTPTERLGRYLGLLNSLSLSYEIANPMEKRRLVKSITSDLWGDGKKVIVELKSPFREVANHATVPTGGPLRHRPRTSFIENTARLLVEHCMAEADEQERVEDRFLLAA